MPLDPRWTTVDPLGDCTFTEVDGELQIAIPATELHDLWTGNMNAPQVLQSCSNTDFDIKTKVNSPLTINNQATGILVKNDANNFIRFDVFSNNGTHRLWCATFVSGTPTTRLNTTTTISAFPFYLRVQRVGNDFTYYTSTDGTTWTSRLVLTYTITANQVGLWAGTAVTLAAFTARFDYFIVDDAFGTWMDVLESSTVTDSTSLGKIVTLSMSITESSTVTDSLSEHKLLGLSLTLSETSAVSESVDLIKYAPKNITLADLTAVLDVLGFDKLYLEQLIWTIRGINYRNKIDHIDTPELINPWISIPPVVDPTEDE